MNRTPRPYPRPPAKTKYARERENELLAFIVRFKMENDGCGPEFREMADALGLSAISDVKTYLSGLVERGLIELPNKPRARFIKVVGGEWRPPEASVYTRLIEPEPVSADVDYFEIRL